MNVKMKHELFSDWYDDHKDDLIDGYIENNEDDFSLFLTDRFDAWLKERKK